ncbi:unnamed protein product [Owenia fusiformis]|uniref:THD domain-containing protein n=1 Tax=Owenia fusiformis TaxID=6347 RepID=A0A8S4N945_OWEFU|nr:unnamed protein product [Owenia fusiformis]
MLVGVLKERPCRFQEVLIIIYELKNRSNVTFSYMKRYMITRLNFLEDVTSGLLALGQTKWPLFLRPIELTMRNLDFNIVFWSALVVAILVSLKCFATRLKKPSEIHSPIAVQEKEKETNRDPSMSRIIHVPGRLHGLNAWSNGGARKKRAIENRIRKTRRKKTKKAKIPSIHVIPKIQNNERPIPASFDKQGNINSAWEVKSSFNMRFIIDSRPRNESICFNEAYIVIKYTGSYFIYGQIFFHGQNHEMGHCLYVADRYRPCGCSRASCEDRKVMCSRSTPGHPLSYKIVQNINTNYIGGIVYLKKGSTIRLGVDANEDISMKKSIELDTSMCYFGAFAV